MGNRRILELFADILDYPGPGLASKARECEGLLADAVPEAAGLLARFVSFVEETPLERLEEVFTGYFDLNPVCHPYVGYHLFGESYKRSQFLLTLKRLYREHGFEIGDAELPDRISVMLRFLSQCGDDALVRDTVVEGVLPAIEHMTGSNGKGLRTSSAEEAKEGPQLEGHSQGEVLVGGFVLALNDEREDTDPSKLNRHPYRQALLALRRVLGLLDSLQVTEGEAIHQGGGIHG